jgi:hypothetical protein
MRGHSRARCRRAFLTSASSPSPATAVLFHCVRLGGFADEYALAARADTLRAAGYPVMRARE